MTAPGLLDFFALEASEYIQRLDALVSGAQAQGPDLEDLARTARALRGSATMARAKAIADVASGLERVGRALKQGVARWDANLAGALIRTVDGLKILLRALKTPDTTFVSAGKCPFLVSKKFAFQQCGRQADALGVAAR